MKRSVTLVMLLAFAACREPEPVQSQTQREPDDSTSISQRISDIDGDNLLNIAYGAAVVSRTGELSLASSAVHAIDGLSFASWSTPPGGAQQTLVFSLGAPSQVEQLGVTTAGGHLAPKAVRFFASSDGESWRDVLTLAPKDEGTKLESVTPFEARFLRVETIEPAKHYSTLASVHAIGRELGVPARYSFDGCWTINSHQATLRQQGARITGVLRNEKAPTYVDGGIEGRVARLMWMRGPMWGYATASLTADGRAISAITFHEEPRFQTVGEAWLGTRCEASIAETAPLRPADYLRRTGHWTLSGLIFENDKLLEEPSRGTLDDAAALIAATPGKLRIVAHEHRNNSADENRRLTRVRIDAVREALRARGADLARVEFVANGSEWNEFELPSAVQRMLRSRIDLERAR